MQRLLFEAPATESETIRRRRLL